MSQKRIFSSKTHFPENIFLKKKLTQSTMRIGDVSLVQNSIKHPQCVSEVSGENSCVILSLKV